ncbi:MAG: hypothetical protein IKW04_00185 [Clostridia bacterium]|nr:hypothetical protein [Clostridia bacterium]
MKRLIALLAGLAVVGSMSMTSFAAFSDEIALNEDGVTYTAALSDEAATANAGKQTTIVAYKGDTIEVGSIQYIDQAAADSFTFQLMDELTENVKVVMGGEAIDKQEVGTIFFEKEADTFTVSGSVANAPAQEFITDELSALAEEIYGAEAVADYVAQYEITASLVAEDEFENLILTTIGEAEEFAAVATTTVSFEDGTFTFEGVEPGTYAVALTANGAMTWVDYAIVEDADVDLGAIDLYYGDVVGAKDAMIDASDVTLVAGNMIDIESEEFVGAYDVNPDCMIDASDVTIVVSNMGDIYAYDTDFINDNF